jgi:DNA-binding GntR family transcriptional regulator
MVSNRISIPPAKLPRQTRPDEAAAYIRGLILTKALRAGDHVNQDAVAEALGISRIPVREALIALEREGWVTIESHRGAFVNPVDEPLVRDYYDILGRVYGFAAERAALRATDAQIDHLNALAKELEATSEKDAIRDLAFTFHAGVINAASSPRLKVILRSMTSLVAGNLFEEVPATVALERVSQLRIVRALRKGDGETAGAEYSRLMRRIGDLVLEHLRENGLFDAD